MTFTNKTSPSGVLIPPWRAIFTYAISFFCIFTSFESMQDLQSSLLYKGNLGPTSLGLIYGFMTVFSIFASAFTYTFGLKFCTIFYFLAHTLYIVSHFYPTPAVLLTSSAILGICMTLNMASLPMYLVGIAHSYIKIKNLPSDKIDGVRSMFNGIYFFFFKGTHLVGNLISSLVLSQSRYDMGQAEYNVCGASICNSYHRNSSIVIVTPEEKEVNILLMIYTGIDIIGLFVIIICTPFFNVRELDKELHEESMMSLPKSKSPPPSSYQVLSKSGASNTESNDAETPRGTTKSNFFDQLKIFIEIWRDSRFLLLIPLIIGQAMVIMMMYTTYTQGFVSCAIGVKWVGYSMMFLGGSGAFASVIVNYLAKYTGRIPLLLTCIFIDTGCVIIMLLWKPNSETPVAALFILPVAAGISEGIFQPQKLVIISSIFKEKKSAVFCATSTIRGVAFCITLFTLSSICLYQQFSIALTFYFLGFIGYIVTEVREYRLGRKLSPGGQKTLSSSKKDVVIRGKGGLYGSMNFHNGSALKEPLMSKAR